MKEEIEDTGKKDLLSGSLPSGDFASAPRSFVNRLARQMCVELSEALVERLVERMRQGASREEITGSLRNIKGKRRPVDTNSAALNFARAGTSRETLIVENVISFAPENDKAFVLYAYHQILGRHPGEVELARLLHQIGDGRRDRVQILKLLNDKAIEEGQLIAWDSAKGLVLDAVVPADDMGRLVCAPAHKLVSQSAQEIVSLCEFRQGAWHLAPSMVLTAEEVRADSWAIGEGFFLTGPKGHLAPGKWLLELDIVQPEWALVTIDVVANMGLDRLFDMTACGNVRGSFFFEKLANHAFIEVRLQVENADPDQWISVQAIRLRKMDNQDEVRLAETRQA